MSAGASSVGSVLIKGRCVAVRRSKDVWYHLVAMPAPDLYSHPSVVEVSAPRRLADSASDFEQLCRVTGYPRQFVQTDRDTGEQRTVRTADVRLTAEVSGS